MKLRFWQKTYILTLLIFVVVLCATVFIIVLLNQKKMLESEQKSALTEHLFRTSNVKRDINQVKDGGIIIYDDILNSYTDFFAKNNVLTEFRGINNDFFSTSIPADIVDKTLNLKLFENIDIDTNFIIKNNGYYFVACSALNENYMIISVVDFNQLFSEIYYQRIFYTLLCLFISIFVSLILFFVLRQVSLPLRRLSLTADKIAGGALSLRARVKGHDEISQLAESFNNMAESIISKMDALEITAEQKERIADNLSHEIRTPLTAIQGYAEFMLIANLSESEKGKALGYIVEESRRLQKISDRMLKLSVMRREEVSLVPTSLDSVFSHFALTISAKAAKAKVNFSMEKPPKLTINGDEILLESLLTNTADNAIKACEEGDSVSVYFSVDHNFFHVIIQDTGHGMSSEEIAKLGEPFYRPDKARSRKAGGAGLGITLCKQIALLHNAKLIYYSAEGKGTEVHISFPLLKKQKDNGGKLK